MPGFDFLFTVETDAEHQRYRRPGACHSRIWSFWETDIHGK